MEAFSHIKELHQSSLWATQKVLDILPEKYLEKELHSSFKNIEEILVHLWFAQTTWHNRITGANNPLPPKPFNGSYNTLTKELINSYSIYVDLFRTKTDSFLNENVTYKTAKGQEIQQPNYQILLQLSHHSAFHRGQIIGFMRQLGFTDTIPQTDLIAWYRESM